jgi:hypothetical protein
VGVVAQGDAGQAAQYGFAVVGGYAQPQAHVAEFDLEVQGFVDCHDAAHQHIAAAAGVFGEGLDADVYALAPNVLSFQIKRVKGQACAPGVV